MTNRKRMLQGLEQDILDHIETETRDNVERGMSPEEARRAALCKFGNVTRVQEETRGVWSVVWLEQLLRDLGYSFRGLRKSPGFTFVAVLTLALGMAATIAVFSVVNSVLLEPLSYPDPEQLVAVKQNAPGAAGLANFSDGLRLSASMYFTYAEHNRAFQSLGVWDTGTVDITGNGEPEQVRSVFISDGVLQALNVPPVAGRWLNAADQDPRGARNAMLNYGYWQRRFGGDTSVIGRHILVDSSSYQIVGVMPQGFRVVNAEPDLIIPVAFDRGKVTLAGFGFQGIARLKAGVGIAQADADLSRMLPIWMDSWSNGPGSNPRIYETWKISPAIRPLKQEVIGNIAEVLWLVMATVVMVMLIACANVANLLLVKGESRQPELGMRSVLGAPRSRIIRQLMLESAMLGLMGGVAGVALSYIGVRALVAMGPANLPRLSEISFGARSLGFTVLLCLLSTVLFGLISVLKYGRPRMAAAIRGDRRTSSTGRESNRARNMLVVAQIAMALVLLVSAGLMIRTFRALRRVEPGFADARHLQLMRISIPPEMVADTDRVIHMQNDILDKLRQIPGVESVAFGSEMPMEGFQSDWDEIMFEGKTYPADEIPPMYFYKHISPGFFQTAGTRLIAGRDLTWTEVYGRRPVGLISENLARESWGTPQNAIGKRFRETGDEPWREVIGVVEDVRENGVNQKAPSIVYWPPVRKGWSSKGKEIKDIPVRETTFVMRSPRAGMETFLSQVRQAVWSVNSNLPVAAVRTMQDVYDQSLVETSFTLVILGIAGAMALVLGIVGIYGVVSWVVGQRVHEIGIRMALGARREHILQMVLGQGGRMAAAGIGLGLLASLGLTRLMTKLLFGVSASDPLTFAAVVITLLAVALLACWIPASRAMRIDPTIALRYE